MFDLPIIDSLLLKLFRFRTRAFLRMVDAPPTVPPPPAGGSGYLYVHIPFCEVLCPFCSFHRVQHRHAQAVRYFTALRTEIRLYHAAGHRFTGVYFGGGTPTTEPAELVTTIELVKALFGVTEISVETNPKDLRPEIVQPLRAAGVTRLSVGVQSFDDNLLREMERYEKYGSGAETRERIRAVAGIFPTLNVDFIFNQPHQTRASLERDLALFRTLGANQVSFYPLMTSPTVDRRMTKQMGQTDPRRLRQFYHTIVQRLAPDFAPSSAWCFTRRGHGTDEYIVAADNYVGVGSGAFSYLDGTLYCTTFSLSAYERHIAQGHTGITTCHRLRETDRLRYTLLVRLFGLHLDHASVLTQHGPQFFRKLWGELLTLRLLGAARADARGWRLNERGMFWLTLMMSAFFESVNNYRDAMRAHVKEELHESVEMCAPAANSLAPAASRE
ncbi:MAG: coproporphyrinogen III oxidase family protein [Candidatus Didemnitutus sp.]|nr:coproporphyrinogen III oxidase family protein [Candidatus Didemnitutus sp.]